MRTSFISLLALASSFTSVLSAPTPEAAGISKRADFDALTFATDLKTTLQPDLDAIKATATSLSADSTDEEKAAASSSIAVKVASLTAAVEAADAQIPATAEKRDLQKRQSSAVGAEIAALIASLSGVADALVAALGLDATLSLLNPLTTSLSKLLLDLEVVVDDLLAIVKQLLDGLLSGLSAGLAGLIL